MKKYNYFFLLLIFSINASCQKTEKKVGGPFYYKSFTGYSVPFKPVGEIPFSETKKLTAYVEVFYNGNGKIEKFTKYLDGRVFITSIYTYRPDGSLESGVSTNFDGKKSIQDFDQKGYSIIPTQTPNH